MNLYLQHGYGKASKMNDLAAAGALRGVILSPGDEGASTLARTAADARRLGLRVYVDPQTYVYSTRPKGLGRKHEEHGIQFDELHWSQDVNSLMRQIHAVGKLHQSINPHGGWIAPTVMQNSLEDVWTSTAFQLARTASSEWGKERTIATLAIDESALDTWRHVDEWLDVATTLEVRGFYILVGRSNATYPPVAWSAERLANLLRLIYVLTQLNDYEVCWGYSDSEGLLGISAGASALAAGWNYSLRQFKPSKWQPTERKGGGAQPIPRFYVQQLWSPILAVGEAENIRASALTERVLTSTEIAQIDARPGESFGVLDAQMQYLCGLSHQASRVAEHQGVGARLDFVQGALRKATERFAEIDAAGIPLERRYSGRVRAMAEAVGRFRGAESV